ncbi:MAG: FISUMP domain-containing protein [Bacteroidota bacterium]
MKIFLLYAISASLLLIMLSLHSCKKDDKPDIPDAISCTITAPADSSTVQIGNIVTIAVSISGFNDKARVSFSLDTVQISEDLEAPFEFTWNTEGWETGPHTVIANAYESTSHVSDEITITLIDTIIPLHTPVALISITPETGNTDSIFSFDASGSYDLESAAEELLYRWDFDGDGSWDTDFTMDNFFLHKYTHPNNYLVKLEVMDTDSMTGDTTLSLHVSHSGSQGACQGYVTVPHGGKVYHTVGIGYQCWLRENMDIGTMITAGSPQTDNDTIEKYCYDNDVENCEKYGGLYQWKEMTDYFPLPGVQGICPTGWHIPSDDEWKELEAYVDTHYGLGDPVWDETSFRGYDAGKNLKSLLGWHSGGNGNNLYDFKAIPGGFWESGIYFNAAGEEARFWSTSRDDGQNAAMRMLKFDDDRIYRSYHWQEAAFSVRCIRD